MRVCNVTKCGIFQFFFLNSNSNSCPITIVLPQTHIRQSTMCYLYKTRKFLFNSLFLRNNFTCRCRKRLQIRIWSQQLLHLSHDRYQMLMRQLLIQTRSLIMRRLFRSSACFEFDYSTHFFRFVFLASLTITILIQYFSLYSLSVYIPWRNFLYVLFLIPYFLILQKYSN